MKIAFLNFCVGLANASTPTFFRSIIPGPLVAINAIGIVDDAVRIRHTDRLRAEIKQLSIVYCETCRCGDKAELAFRGVSFLLFSIRWQRVNGSHSQWLRTESATPPQ